MAVALRASRTMSKNIYAEITRGRVSNITRGSLPLVGVSYLDITDFSPQPEIGWLLNRAGDLEPPARFSRPEADIKQAAIDRTNELAGKSRAKYIVTVPGQSETDMLKSEELGRIDTQRDAPNPRDYPVLAERATQTRTTFADMVIIARAERTEWIQVAAKIEGIRQKALQSIAAATTEQQVQESIPTEWP